MARRPQRSASGAGTSLALPVHARSQSSTHVWYALIPVPVSTHRKLLLLKVAWWSLVTEHMPTMTIPLHRSRWRGCGSWPCRVPCQQTAPTAPYPRAASCSTWRRWRTSRAAAALRALPRSAASSVLLADRTHSARHGPSVCLSSQPHRAPHPAVRRRARARCGFIVSPARARWGRRATRRRCGTCCARPAR